MFLRSAKTISEEISEEFYKAIIVGNYQRETLSKIYKGIHGRIFDRFPENF